MNSKVIKFVAGAGKTTYSREYMTLHKNGIYFAFTNSVIDDIKNSGVLAKTFDSFFCGYILPKFIEIIPIINSSSKITYLDITRISNNMKGITNIRVDEGGKIYNRNKLVKIDINCSNEELHNMDYFNNSQFLKYIFSKKELRLTDQLRNDISKLIIKNYPQQIVQLINSRFSYVIVDEAQDLKDFREEFAKLLYDSNIYTVFLGDDNQNINAGGKWFESLVPNEEKKVSLRCPDNNCKWIRENLEIEIYGNNSESIFSIIEYNEVMQYDDGKKNLLYCLKSGKKNIEIINNWKGPKFTIKSAKGITIDNDVVIIGNSMSNKNLYTAITRTRSNVYCTIKLKN